MVHNKGVYEGIDLIPFYINFFLLGIFFLALAYAACGAWSFNVGPRNSQALSCCSRWARWFYTVLKKGGEMWLSHILMHEFKKDGEEFVLKGCRIPKWYVFLASIMPVTIVSFVILAFWEVFLIRVSFACSDDVSVDCFHANDSLSAQPLNCSELTGDDNVICYAFVFDFVLGFSAAGGTLSIMTTAISLSISFEIAIVLRFKKVGTLLFLPMVAAFPSLICSCITILAFPSASLDRKTIGQILFAVIAVNSTFVFPWFAIKKDPSQGDEEEGDLCPPCFQCCCRGTTDQENKPSVQDNKYLIHEETPLNTVYANGCINTSSIE